MLNSFLDNFDGEPASAHLKDLFTAALKDVVDPLATAEAPGSLVDVVAVATELADRCLCAQPQFNLEEMITRAPATQAVAMTSLLEGSDPLLGLSADDRRSLLKHVVEVGEKEGGERGRESLINSSRPSQSLVSPADIFANGNSRVKEAYLQSNVLKLHRHGYGTRMQSVVLAEHVPATVYSKGSNSCSGAASGGGEASMVVHVAQRGVGCDSATQQYTTEPWICYAATRRGGVSLCSDGTHGDGVL